MWSRTFKQHIFYAINAQTDDVAATSDDCCRVYLFVFCLVEYSFFFCPALLLLFIEIQKYWILCQLLALAYTNLDMPIILYHLPGIVMKCACVWYDNSTTLHFESSFDDSNAQYTLWFYGFGCFTLSIIFWEKNKAFDYVNALTHEIWWWVRIPYGLTTDLAFPNHTLLGNVTLSLFTPIFDVLWME